MEKINLGDGSAQSGDDGITGGGKINDNFKAVIAALNGVDIWDGNTSELIDLSNLSTINKASLIGAINENYSRADLIKDSLTTSLFKTWSIDKMKLEFATISSLDSAIATSAYGIKYTWADAAARAAQTGMVALEQGVQEDTRTVYSYDGAAWVEFYSLDPLNWDDRYFTETESDARFAKLVGDNVFVGNQDITGTFDVTGDFTLTGDILTESDEDFRVIPAGTGDVYFGTALTGAKFFHYSYLDDGVYTTYEHTSTQSVFATTGADGFVFEDVMDVLGNIIATGGLKLPDNAVLAFGNDSDVALSHSGAANYWNINKGDLYFKQKDNAKKFYFEIENSLGVNQSVLTLDATYINAEQLLNAKEGIVITTDLNITSIPTSSAGLSSGDVWSDSGTLKIV